VESKTQVDQLLMLTVKIDDAVYPESVKAPFGWDDANINRVTSAELTAQNLSELKKMRFEHNTMKDPCESFPILTQLGFH
jgi:hypothetical protein